MYRSLRKKIKINTKRNRYLKVLHFKNESVITNIPQRNIEGYNALIVNSSKIGKKKTIATTKQS